jgi:hypothetical protein
VRVNEPQQCLQQGKQTFMCNKVKFKLFYL